MIKPYYQDEQATIYCADCRDVLPQLEKVDLCLCDPPYGINEAAGKNKSRGKLATPQDYGFATWDNERISKDIFQLIQSDNLIIFGGNYYADIFPASQCWLVWDKDNTGDFADCELAYTSFDSAVRLIKYRWNGMLQQNMKDKEQRWHPTQKPIRVMEWCIEQADKKAKTKPMTILDPFMGVGTSLVAAKNLGRKAIGIEISFEYCEIAVNRLRQQVLF